MYSVLQIESVEPKVMNVDLLEPFVANRWLAIADIVADRNIEGLEFAITYCNRLYLVISDEASVNPVKFAIRGAVSDFLGTLPVTKVRKYKSAMEVIRWFIEEGKLMVDLAFQLIEQLPPEYRFLEFEDRLTVTGASKNLLDKEAPIYYNGLSYYPAVAPLAELLERPGEPLHGEDLWDL